MSELSLPEKIVAIDQRLRVARIAHAFGGALALAYYAEPRATIDIDVNIFVSPARFDHVVAAIEPLGVDVSVDRDALERDGQCRLRWGRTPLDCFFSYDPIHDAMRKSTRKVPFAGTTVPILAPEHLIVCKAVFDRPKDWLDIEQVLVAADHVDRDEVDTWLTRIAGAKDPRKQQFDALAGDLLGPL